MSDNGLETAVRVAVETAVEQHYLEENDILREELRDIQKMFAFEDQGYTPITDLNSEGYPGLSLAQLKEHSATIRERAIGVPIIKRAIALRNSYVFSKGVNIPGLPQPGDKKSAGRPSRLQAFCENPINDANFFSASAKERMSFASATDGAFLLIGDDNDGTVRTVPVSDITEIMTNPDYPDEIWAYKRSWTRHAAFGKRPIEMEEWIYNDTCPVPKTNRPKEIGPEKVQVAQKKTMLDIHFNTQVGWPLGVPDALSAVPWARIYTELLHHGKVMTEALARIAFKVVTSSPASANRIGAQMRQPGAGKTAAIGTGNELLPLSTAGRTYDFNGIRPVAAQVATAMEVSIVHLLSDPGAAGSSYGSAANLDLPTKRAMVARQNVWAGYFERVLKWAAGHEVTVTFPSLDDPDPYREMQTVVLATGTGAVYPDEVRGKVLAVGEIDNLHGDNPPAGYMTPNNRNSLPRKDVDADGLNVQAAPDQGVGNGGGGVDSTLASSDAMQ